MKEEDDDLTREVRWGAMLMNIIIVAMLLLVVIKIIVSVAFRKWSRIKKNSNNIHKVQQ